MDYSQTDIFNHFFRQKVIISLCDYTGIAVKPWVENGYYAVLVDPQHALEESILSFEDNTLKIGLTIIEAMPILRCIIATNDVHFISCFPPCTEFASSGARWWASKAQNDRYFQAKAALIVEQCRTFAETVGAPYFIENPVGALTSIIGKQSYAFHPYYFTNFAPEDNYTKRTFLWTGNGFVMPPDNINTDLDLPDANRIHFCSPGKDRANKRSMTPYGFAKAVYEANKRL